MPVRNPEKATLAKGGKTSSTRRKVFKGDIASIWKPEHNPTPLPGSRKLKPDYERPRRKAPKMLVAGKAQRPHRNNGKTASMGVGYVCLEENMVRMIPLTRAYKKNKS